jgi:hypothetical protein
MTSTDPQQLLADIPDEQVVALLCELLKGCPTARPATK